MIYSWEKNISEYFIERLPYAIGHSRQAAKLNI